MKSAEWMLKFFCRSLLTGTAFVVLAGLAGCAREELQPVDLKEPEPVSFSRTEEQLLQKDPSTGCELWVSWDQDHLFVRIGNLKKLIESTSDYSLYVFTRTPDKTSGAVAAPPARYGEEPALFRWQAITANPLPADAVNANPNAVHRLPVTSAQGADIGMTAFESSTGDEEWKISGTYEHAGLEQSLYTVAVPWTSVGLTPQEVERGAYLDLAVLLYDEPASTVDLVFPVENGRGPKVLLSYVFSFAGLGPEADMEVVNTADTDFQELVFADDFESDNSEWRELYAEGAAGGGSVRRHDGRLEILLNQDGLYGVYHPKPVAGTFDVRAEIALDAGAACGLTLFKKSGDEPDLESYLRLERTTDEQGRAVVRLFAQDGGKPMTEQWYKTTVPYFEYVLGDEEFGTEAKALRILRDERASCLRFYYLYEREVDGIPIEGWMEFHTLSDRDLRGYYVCPYVRSSGGQTASASVDSVIAKHTRRDDPDDPPRFGVTRRDYTFSGVSGDAVVLTFDKQHPFHEKTKFVFWREANYIPWWHIDDKCAVSYEFVEIWGGGTTWKGKEPGGCCEPMSDRLLRWSNVDILEANDARVIVRWQYVLANPEYQWWGLDAAKRPVVEEIYCFYPDGVGVRTITYYPAAGTPYGSSWNEISEPMMVHRGGVYPGECLSRTPLTMLDLVNKRDDYTYLTEEPEEIKEETKFWNQVIVRINLNNRPAVFESFSQSVDTYPRTFPAPYVDWWGSYHNDWHTKLKGGYEYEGDYWPFAHWPISRIPYEDHTRTMGRYLREPGHTSILSVPGHPGATESTTWAMLIGLAPPDDDNGLRAVTASWLYPGTVRAFGEGFSFVTNDLYERTLVFETETPGSRCQFSLKPDPVTVNPVFVVRGWGAGDVELYANDKRVSRYRYRTATSGEDAVIWLNQNLWEEQLFRVEPRE